MVVVVVVTDPHRPRGNKSAHDHGAAPKAARQATSRPDPRRACKDSFGIIHKISGVDLDDEKRLVVGSSASYSGVAAPLH